MSPRRGSEETEKMGEEARQALVKQAKAVKETLLEIANCLQSLQSEQEKLEDGNRCLQHVTILPTDFIRERDYRFCVNITAQQYVPIPLLRTYHIDTLAQLLQLH